MALLPAASHTSLQQEVEANKHGSFYTVFAAQLLHFSFIKSESNRQIIDASLFWLLCWHSFWH